MNNPNESDLASRSIFNARVDAAIAHWEQRCRPRHESGLALYMLTIVTRAIVLRVVCNIYRIVIGQCYPLARCMASGLPDDGVVTYRWASDIYKVIMDMILCIAYCIVSVIVVYNKDGFAAACLVCIGVACGVFRLFEIVVLTAILSLDESYVIKNPARAIVNTLWHYLEIALGFAILYLGLAFVDPRAIVGSNERSLADNPVAALYFSIVTLMTLGYGDYAPAGHSWMGMVLVISELVSGSFMLLVVLQKSVSMGVNASLNRQRPETNTVR